MVAGPGPRALCKFCPSWASLKVRDVVRILYGVMRRSLSAPGDNPIAMETLGLERCSQGLDTMKQQWSSQVPVTSSGEE